MNAYLINYVQRGFSFFFARCSSVYVLSWWGLYCLVFIWYLINVVSFLLNRHLGSFVVKKYYFYISGLLTCEQLCYTVKTPGHNPRIRVNLSALDSAGKIWQGQELRVNAKDPKSLTKWLGAAANQCVIDHLTASESGFVRSQTSMLLKYKRMYLIKNKIWRFHRHCTLDNCGLCVNFQLCVSSKKKCNSKMN